MSPYIEYESPVCYCRKVMCKVKFFFKCTHFNYESPMCNGKSYVQS